MKGCLTIAVLLAALNAQATSIFDPAFRFRQIATEHFVIYFHAGEERPATRLSAIAEETWRTLERPLGVRPPKMTRVVLVDQTELFNGYATPLPYDTIVIYAAWPSVAQSVGQLEGFPETFNPGYFIIKLALLLLALLTLLQGVVEVFRARGEAGA